MISQIDCDSPWGRLPAETWLRIFVDACTDNGASGRALSLVSRYFRAVSRPVKHRCIALHGPIQIVRCYAHLANEEAGSDLRHVESLLIASHSDNDHGNTEALEAESVIPSLLTLISPTLKCLSLSVQHSQRLATLLRMPYPALEELTIKGMRGRTGRSNKQPADHTHPRLQRLHIVNKMNAVGQLQEIVQCAPRITHLRFSGLYWSLPKDVDETLTTLVRGGVSDSGAGAGRHRLPDRMVQVVLQPTTPVGGKCGIGLVARGQMIRRIQGYASANPVIKYSVAPVDFSSVGGDMQRQWLERNIGGMGCWM